MPKWVRCKDASPNGNGNVTFRLKFGRVYKLISTTGDYIISDAPGVTWDPSRFVVVPETSTLVECLNISSFANHTFEVGGIYEVDSSFSHSQYYYIIGQIQCGWSKCHFKEVSKGSAQQTASQTSNNGKSVKEELSETKFFRTSAHPGQCPCGIPQSACIYHK